MVSTAPRPTSDSSAPNGTSPWRNQWHPVAYVRDLDRSRPSPFTLLDEDLVIWWDRSAEHWQVFADVCPHRLVPLSEGRLSDDGLLECPYHGWCFDGAGRCRRIPQAEAGTSLGSARSSCRRYASAEAQGLLFVFAGEAGASGEIPLPVVPVLDEPGDAWTVQDTFRDLPMDALTLLENVLDVSHVPFTHHLTVGRRENAAPVDAELTSFTQEGFTAVWEEGPRKGRLGSQFTTFRAPGLMWHDLTAKGFARILTVVYAVPIRRGECRLFARFPFRFESKLPGLLLKLRPLWLQHIGNHKVLEDDQVFLHWQERVLEKRGRSGAASRAFVLATGADLYVRALHDWVNTYQGDPFPEQALPPRRSRDSLMDRHDSHTRSCRSCSTALRRIRRFRPLVLWAGGFALLAIAWFHTTAAWAAGIAALVVAAGLHARLGLWERQLMKGDGTPPRNLT